MYLDVNNKIAFWKEQAAVKGMPGRVYYLIHIKVDQQVILLCNK